MAKEKIDNTDLMYKEPEIKMTPIVEYTVILVREKDYIATDKFGNGYLFKKEKSDIKVGDVVSF